MLVWVPIHVVLGVGGRREVEQIVQVFHVVKLRLDRLYFKKATFTSEGIFEV